jgi:hypothetical protein
MKEKDMRHEEFLAHILEYREGGLAPPDRAAWEAHRASCGSCRGIAMRWTDAKVPAGFSVRVMARVSLGKEKFASGWMIRTGWAVAAALLVAAFWHPEKSWVRADRAFSSFGLAQNQLMITSHRAGGDTHE